MPTHLDNGARSTLVAQAAQRLILARGMRGLSLRAIAHEVGISPATLIHQFTHWTRLQGYLAVRARKDHLDRMLRRSVREGILALLPVDADDIDRARVWLAWCDLARSEAGFADVLAVFREEQVAFVDELTGRMLDEAALDLLVASTDGLTARVCDREEPLPLERATAALLRQLRVLGLDPETGTDDGTGGWSLHRRAMIAASNAAR